MDPQASMHTCEEATQGWIVKYLSRFIHSLLKLAVEPSPPSAVTECAGVLEMGSRSSDGGRQGAASQNGGSEAEFLLPHPGHLPPEMGEKVEELKLQTYWRFSSAMGLCDILIDVDRYFSYLYLIHVLGCDFAAEYGVRGCYHGTIMKR